MAALLIFDAGSDQFTESEDQWFACPSAAIDQGERCLISEGGGQEGAQSLLVDPVSGVVLGQISDVSAREDQNELGLHVLDGGRSLG